MAVQIATILLAIIMGCVALLLVVAAVYLQLATLTTPAFAALGAGAAALVFAVFCLAAGQIAARRSDRIERLLKRDARNQCDEHALAVALTSLVGDELGLLMRKHSRGAAATALLGGLIVGFSPGLRKTLADLLKDVAK